MAEVTPHVEDGATLSRRAEARLRAPAQFRQIETVIRPSSGWINFDLRIFWRFRDLLWLFVRRDVTVRYRQTLLGPLWLIIQPLTMTGVLSLILKGFAKMPTDGSPSALFYMSGLVVWGYFAQTVLAITMVFIHHEHLFSKVYFPRLLVPASNAISALVGLCIQLVLLVTLMVSLSFAGWRAPSPEHLLLLPAAMLQLFVFSLGVGLIFASCTAKYRDLANAAPFLIQVWLFLTPVVYSFSVVPKALRAVVAVINPLAPLVDVWRCGVLGASNVTPVEIGLSIASTLVVFCVGFVLFQRVERTVSDVI